MDGVTQTIADTETGNCLQAAVATFLGLALDDVPHFVLYPDWEGRMRSFMKAHGQPVHVAAGGPGVSGIAVGPTVRGTEHAVVLVDGVVRWDPHPSRAGLLDIRRVYAVDGV